MADADPKRATFRPHERLQRPADFDRVYEGRCSAANEWLLVYARENGLSHSRLGLSVSRKVGGAVQRNRIRRLYREGFRLTKADLPKGLDLVLIPRKPESPRLEDVKRSLVELTARLARRLACDAKEP